MAAAISPAPMEDGFHIIPEDLKEAAASEMERDEDAARALRSELVDWLRGTAKYLQPELGKIGEQLGPKKP